MVMGVLYNPRIVTDGLVFCVDAANIRSYPKTGTTCTDLEGGNNGTLTNMDAANFSSDNGGVLSFDGSNETVVYSNDLGITGNNPWTISCFVKCLTVTNSRQWIFWVGPHNQSANQLLSVGIKNQLFEVSHWSNDTTFTDASVNFGVFQNISVTFDGSTELIYLDAEVVGSKSTVLSLSDGVVYLCSRAASSSFLNCSMASLMVHNKALTADEIRQNYLATKGRYQ